MNDRRLVARTLATAAMLLAMLASPARADHDVASALFVSKSENKNQVHYAVRVDKTCAPEGNAPVYAYWRMLERGPTAIEPLLDREQQAYGIARQDVIRTEAGVSVRVVLRALPSRPITIHVARGQDGSCVQTAETTIGRQRARLFNVHVALGFLRVDHLLVTGWAEPDGRVVRERIDH